MDENETAPVFVARVIALGSTTRQILSKHPNLNLHLASIRIEYQVSNTEQEETN